MNPNHHSSITDQPILSSNEEALDIGNYVSAMVGFIKECATPLTIGVQGEWGSGKTSILNLIRDGLVRQSMATAWVNTWEYAMFRNDAQIVPAVLKGLLESLEQECKATNGWPKALVNRMEKVTAVIQSFGRFALDASVRKATGKDGFSDALQASAGNYTRAEIAELKNDIRAIIDILIEDPANPFEKVIFFIDDLDRIDPSIAVAILEALKNILDLPHCVFTKTCVIQAS